MCFLNDVGVLSICFLSLANALENVIPLQLVMFFCICHSSIAPCQLPSVVTIAALLTTTKTGPVSTNTPLSEVRVEGSRPVYEFDLSPSNKVTVCQQRPFLSFIRLIMFLLFRMPSIL